MPSDSISNISRTYLKDWKGFHINYVTCQFRKPILCHTLINKVKYL